METRWLGIGIPLAMLAVMSTRGALAGCQSRVELSYPTNAPRSVGDTVRMHIALGAGEIQGGSALTINRLRFEPDCANTGAGSLGPGCTDDGEVVSFQGNITTTCAGVNWTADHNPGEFFPNQVVFTPSSPVVIPSNVEESCAIEFDVKVESRSNDITPYFIEQAAGIGANTGDAVCNTDPVSVGGETSVGAIGLCEGCLPVTCNSRASLSYPFLPIFSAVGDTVRVRISVGPVRSRMAPS